MPYILVKDLPDTLQSALKSCSYAKKDVQVLVQEKESLFSSSGKGYQSFASVVDIGSGEMKNFEGSWGGSNAFNPENMVDNNANEYKIPHNVAIIRGFRGGTSGITHATITISPSNMLPCLTSGGSELSEEEKYILAIMRSYKPAYRKPHLDNNKDMVESLVERGYIARNKVGSLSLTTLGKSACEGVRVY